MLCGCAGASMGPAAPEGACDVAGTWAGLVPVGGLLGGIVIDATSMSAVLLGGAAVAAILAVVVDLREPAAERILEPR